jgi:hypothetical protein
MNKVDSKKDIRLLKFSVFGSLVHFIFKIFFSNVYSAEMDEVLNKTTP